MACAPHDSDKRPKTSPTPPACTGCLIPKETTQAVAFFDIICANLCNLWMRTFLFPLICINPRNQRICPQADSAPLQEKTSYRAKT